MSREDGLADDASELSGICSDDDDGVDGDHEPMENKSNPIKIKREKKKKNIGVICARDCDNSRTDRIPFRMWKRKRENRKKRIKRKKKGEIEKLIGFGICLFCVTE